MADVIINGTTYSGSPINAANPQRPLSIERKTIKVGQLFVSANGTTTWVHRATKLQWVLNWGSKANSVTQAAVRAIYVLTTTFSYTDFNSSVYTCVTVGDDDYAETITTDRTNTYKYDLTLTIREA